MGHCSNVVEPALSSLDGEFLQTPRTMVSRERNTMPIARCFVAIALFVGLFALSARGEDLPKLAGPIVEYSFKEATPADEALIFTPAGFEKPGVPAQAEGPEVAHLAITVR